MPAAQKLCCVVEQVIPHGGRVYTVTLRPERQVPRFRPGQFLHLALDPYDPSRFWPESRVFSIASSPAERDCIRLTYSANGSFSARMENELTEGREVWIKMPYGDFVIESNRDVVLIAGGTGITAFTAYLEQLDPTSGQAVTVAYGARTARLLIYRDLVERSARRVGSLSAFYFIEHDPGEGAPPDAVVGRVSVASIWPRLRRPLDAGYYISGPPPMLRDIAADLRGHDVPSEAIHVDAWE